MARGVGGRRVGDRVPTAGWQTVLSAPTLLDHGSQTENRIGTWLDLVWPWPSLVVRSTASQLSTALLRFSLAPSWSQAAVVRETAVN